MIFSDCKYFDAIDGTWSPKQIIEMNPWRIRKSDCGGKRVTATTATGSVTDSDIDVAELEMNKLGQALLFMLRPEDEALNSQLLRRGYRNLNETTIFTCSTTDLTNVSLPKVTVFNMWEPLAIMDEMWDKGGIGLCRRKVMSRVKVPKTGFFVRLNDKPVGVGFAAIDGPIAMVHALHVSDQHRRKKAATWLVRGAARWAESYGAQQISVACLNANFGAKALFLSLGFLPAVEYHYCMKD
ncbi:MAG: GNAT family N-acetyltransferase [Aestuariivita sp.]|nr:GNAT family N-acetyltransferase [Aestuariivita sp.]